MKNRLKFTMKFLLSLMICASLMYFLSLQVGAVISGAISFGIWGLYFGKISKDYKETEL